MKLGMVFLGFTTCPLQLPFSLPPFLLDYSSSSAVQSPHVWNSGFLAGYSSFWGFLRFLNHLIVIFPLKNHHRFGSVATSLHSTKQRLDGIIELPPFDEPQTPAFFRVKHVQNSRFANPSPKFTKKTNQQLDLILINSQVSPEIMMA